jgi:hypothetical protein
MAVVPLYPGFNADRQLTILVETYHYDLRISDLLGPEKTLEFLVEALVIDASLAHAEKLAVFAAPWGRSAEVANYIASLAKRGEPIRYFESYRFELVDPTNAALANSPTGQFHYTESLGYGRPSSGTIDFGYNLVGLGTIDKLTTGGRGIFEIDVRDWLQRDGRQGRVPAKQEGVAQAPDPPLHGNPSERREEIERREQDRLVHARDDIGKRIPGALVEVVGPGDLALRDSVAALHRETASACQEGFVSRLCKQGAELLAVHAGRTVLGAVLAAQLDTLQADAVHLDFVLPIDGCDATVARRLLSLAVELATVRGCRHLFLRPASDAAATIASAEHFVPATGVPSLGPQLYRKLWLFGPENRPAIDAAIEAPAGDSLHASPRSRSTFAIRPIPA